jgi:hypothetical protein
MNETLGCNRKMTVSPISNAIKEIKEMLYTICYKKVSMEEYINSAEFKNAMKKSAEEIEQGKITILHDDAEIDKFMDSL